MKPCNIMTIATCLGLVGLSQFALAEETVSLETITVKGTKDDRNYFESPTSVSIFKENEIPALGSENSIQILNAVPNVQVNKTGESFSIRGINNTGVTGYQKDNLASVLIDDIFQTDLAIQSGTFDLWDLDRIEVLKGAQSTTQGINSLAGSILLDHKRPVLDTEGAAKLGLGSFWNREAGLVSNNVLIKNKLATRISVDREMNDGYITNATTGNSKWGGWDRERLSLGGLYRISDRDELNFTGKFNRSIQGGTYVQGSDPYKYQVTEDNDYKATTTNYQAGGNYDHVISDQWRSKLLLGFSKSRQGLNSDADGTAQDTAGKRVEDHDDHFYSFEERLIYKSDKLSNLIGFHAHDFALKDDYTFNLLYPLSAATSTPVGIQQTVDRTNQAYAIFDSATYHFNEMHSIEAGLRGELNQSKYGADVLGTRLQDLGTTTNTKVDAYLESTSGDYEGRKSSFVLLPKLGYGFDLGGHHAGLTYTRGYRTAGVSINRRRAQAVDYDPEFTNNYEASYKYNGKASGHDYQLSSNLFYTDWRSQQVQVQLSSDFYDTQVQNAGKSALYGAEVEGSYRIDSIETLGLGVGYTDTKFQQFQTRSFDYAGKQFPFASHWTARLAHTIKPLQDLNILTVLRYVSGAFNNAENTKKSGAQFYVDLNAKYVLSSVWIIEGYANNLLNGKYLLYDGSPTSTTTPYQASYNQVSTPREFGVRVNCFW